MRPLELYIHIPFCASKCKYCDFLSAPATEAEREEYVKGLCQKLRTYAELAEAYRVISIFVGGGTPSLLTAEQAEKIFRAVRETFSVEEDAEITIEMNPGSVTKAKLASYKKIGVNRLSIGLQSVHNEELKILGRIHTYEDFLETYEMAREEGFQNINIDLMFAIPHQTVGTWKETLHKTAGLQPEHISAYSLIIEEGTPFYEMYGEGRNAQELPGEEEECAMYQIAGEVLKRYGYARYEISNYAKEGFECRHNLGYWNRTEYLGIGTGAASLMNHMRWNEGEQKEALSLNGQMEECMFLGLRKMKGVSKQAFEEEFGQSIEEIYGNVIENMKEKGLIEDGEGFVRLTEKGISISNYVMSEFLMDG